MTPQRTESFIPLTAATATPERREFPVTILPGQTGGTPGQFRPLATPPPISQAALPPSSCEPRVTVQRDAKRITHLHIQCTCGQTIDLACLYDEAQAA